MRAIIMHIPAGNGYTIKTLNERASPHIKQALHVLVDFSDGYLWANSQPENAVSVDLTTYYAQQVHQEIRTLLELHYGLKFSHEI